MTDCTFPVWGFGTPETVAVFFDDRSAGDFITDARQETPMQGFERRTLFLGVPDYDRRDSGYRFDPVAARIEADLNFTLDNLKSRRAA